ncbi:hypothetical protein, partial [Klebsiella variicola]|uniref:hypothetical protein n=1 Tax=Klebsiella variicola TaxID=244366 RepID=UPI001BAD3362
LHGDVLMWLMKTLLTSGCTNQRGAGHTQWAKCLTMSFTLKKTCSRIFIITPIVQKNGDGHIQELCIYTALIGFVE